MSTDFTSTFDRLLELTSGTGESFLLASLTIYEELSQPFRLEALAYSTNHAIGFDQMLGQPVSIRVGHPDRGTGRYFHGYVSRFTQGRVLRDVSAYRMEIVPWLWFLDRGANCRIFESRSVIEILRSIFSVEPTASYDLPNLKKNAEGNEPTLDYCVQYSESDFAFASRLMERAGFGYYFQHSADAHELTGFDASMEPPEHPGEKQFEFRAEETPGARDARGAGWIDSFERSLTLHPGTYTVDEFNHENPLLDLVSSVNTKHRVAGNERFEVYSWATGHKTFTDGNDIARRHAALGEQRAHEIVATSSCAALTAGYVFTLTKHPRDAFNGPYLITKLEATISQELETLGIVQSGGCRNRIHCLPAGKNRIPFVPSEKTPKPRVDGLHTAVVWSPQRLRKVDVDDLGRILVVFPWARPPNEDNPRDLAQQHSARIRVAQSRAGKKWGGISWPHVDQEVMIAYQNGDPDLPIVVGSVYNRLNEPDLQTTASNRTLIRDHGGVQIEMGGGTIWKDK